jgi:hypothetical protein
VGIGPGEIHISGNRVYQDLAHWRYDYCLA